MHFNDPNTMWAATNGGIYKTTDGGQSWNQTQNGAFQGVKQKPNNPQAQTKNKQTIRPNK